jgi:tRNA modification GTPase
LKTIRPTYVTRWTSQSPAAISVIELDGPQALEWLQRCWHAAHPRPLHLDEIRYGQWRGADPIPRANLASKGAGGVSQAAAYEDVVVCQTGPERLEIHAHGGRMAAQRIIDELIRCGAVPLSGLESRDRQHEDPWTRAAWRELLETTTPRTTAIMLDQARGALAAARVQIEAAIAAGATAEALPAIDRLLAFAELGQHLTRPWQIAVAGPPNVGKSSLLNAILGYQRAIVTPAPGTTRDLLAEQVSLLGWPFRLIDTAGLRHTADAVEQMGLEQAHQAIVAADLTLCLIDPCEGWTGWHDQLARETSTRLLLVHTKSDLGWPLPSRPDLACQAVSVSAQRGEGLEGLYAAMVARLVGHDPPAGTAVPFRTEQLQYLRTLRAQLLET